jgi:hypothetical protein
MWLLNANPRLKLPEAFFLKRLAAPRFVFIFGMTTPGGRIGLFNALLKRSESFPDTLPFA